MPLCDEMYSARMMHQTCVYVVDNDTSARNGLIRLVRTAGHDGRGFASVKEFLDALEPAASGCVVLDAGMPGLSAEEVLREVLREILLLVLKTLPKLLVP